MLPGLGISCATNRPPKVGLPAKNSIRADQLLIVSDLKLPRDHPLINDLKTLRRQVWERTGGSTTTNSLSAPMNLTDGSMFYRLTYP